MVQVTVNDKTQAKELPFPKLMIRKADIDYTLIFATQKRDIRLEGLCVATNYLYDTVGDYSDQWIAEAFTDFHGSITLQNEQL
jgi:hypothetical protein